MVLLAIFKIFKMPDISWNSLWDTEHHYLSNIVPYKASLVLPLLFLKAFSNSYHFLLSVLHLLLLLLNASLFSSPYVFIYSFSLQSSTTCSLYFKALLQSMQVLKLLSESELRTVPMSF